MARTQIGEQLVRAGLIDALQLRAALAYQRQWGGRLGTAIVRMGFLPEHEVLSQVARQLGVALFEIGDRRIAPEILRLVPEKLIRARKIIPVGHLAEPRPGVVIIATAEPQAMTVVDEVAFASGKKVKAVLAGDEDVASAIARHLGRGAG